MSRLEAKDGGYYLDGKPFRIVSGAIHYFRVVPEYWRDRLSKLALCGMNCVETYTCWNLHERTQGSFDFKNGLDLARFLEIAGELGLFVILRPGPYICGEWDKGGLPSWLEAVPGMKLRCSNEPFLSAVKSYFSELFKVVRPYLAENGGPVIAVQIENEYGSFGDDHEYMESVRKILCECGVKELMFTSDGPGYFMLNGGSLKNAPATINFGSNPKDNFKLLRSFRADAPLVCTEYWNGWFDHWYEEHHTRASGDTAQVMKEMLQMGASVNMYMFHGGTNFGFNNGANFDRFLQPTVTSYDYNCPVSECGDLTEKFYAVREAVYEALGKEVPKERLSNPKKKAYGRVCLTEAAGLFENILKLRKKGEVNDPCVRSFEELGADFGYMLYSTVLTGPFEELELSIDGLNDRAQVYLTKLVGEGECVKEGERVYLGTKENTGKRDDRITAGLGFNESARLDILVENLGRVNYGGHISDHKGITGGVRFANCYHYGWKMQWLPVEEPGKADFKSINESKDVLKKDSCGFRPTLFRGFFEAGTGEKAQDGKDSKDGKELTQNFAQGQEKQCEEDFPADTFLKLSGFHKGCAYINGFNLGRYWNDAGPQKTLYIPGPLLKKGRNELIVFETDGVDLEANDLHVTLTDSEELG